MSLSSTEKMNQLFVRLKANPGTDTSFLCEQMTELFPILVKEDQKNFSNTFYNWAKKYKIKYPVIFCYARHLELANHFFSEHHETVLSEGPSVQKAFFENNEPGGAAATEAYIGSVYRTLGNIDLSLKSLWDGYRQLNQLNRFLHFKMACSFHIGSIYTDLNNYEEALPILKNTLSLSEKVQDSLWIIYASHGLGKLYLKQKNYENARVMFEKAMEVAHETMMPSLISSAETEMGNYHFETGNYDESELLHTKAVDIRIANNFTGGAITNYIRLGEINVKQSQPEEAIAVLNKGLLLAEQIKVKPKMYQIHLLLSEIYHCKNDLVKSLFHYKQYHFLQDEAYQEDNAKKIKNVKLLFEAEQTKKENIIIKKQKAEIQNKNIELQDTIDELTITKAGKKAKAFTLLIAIVFFIFEDSILHFVLPLLPADNFYISLCVKMAIIFSLKPINSVIEHHLVKKVIKKKSKVMEEENLDNEIPAELDFAA
ncbi:MAG: tetratricopeptide repeat protein [Chitinophagales bacterium]